MRWQTIKKFLLDRIGHRGAFLLLLGSAFIFYGIGVLAQPYAYDIYPYKIIPWETWGYMWIGAGFISLFGAFRRLDRTSFTVATTASALWSIRWFNAAFKMPHAGLWATGFTWAVITGLILIVSTWPEVHIRFDNDGPDPPNEYREEL